MIIYPLLLFLLHATSSLPARAEYWGSSMEDLLQNATVIAWVRPSAGVLVVTRPLRGTQAGATLAGPLLAAPMPPGEGEVLAICDRAMCPRAIGTPMGAGLWRIDADEYGDGASVYPGILTTEDLDAALRGEPMGIFCVDARVTFLGGPPDERPLSLRGVISAANGEGQFSLEGQPLTGSLQYGEGWLSSHPEGVLVRLASQTLLGIGIETHKDGECLSFEVSPAQPFSRSRNQIQKALHQTFSPQILATGTVVIEGEAHSAARLQVDAHGQLVLSGVPGVEGSPSLMATHHLWKDTRVGFGGISRGDRILFGIPGGTRWERSSLPMHLTQLMVDRGGSMTWAVYRGEEVVGAAVWTLAPVSPE